MRLAILLLSVGLVLAQQQPLNPYNRLPNTQDQLNPNNRLPNTQNQRLRYDWWQKLQEFLRPQAPNPDSVAQQLPLHPNNQLPNTHDQQLPFNWWQNLQDLLNRPRPPRPDSDNSNQDSGVAQTNIQCGKTSLSTPPINHFIVGGQEAMEGQFPWQVYLKTKSGSFYCGGSYVTANGHHRVITAAHCMGQRDVFVTFNAHDRINDNDQVTLKASEILVHPRYNSRTLVNDIAVLHFTDDDAAVLTGLPNVAPICLVDAPYTGKTATVSGWGTTAQGGSVSQKLMFAEKPLLTNQQCKETKYNAEWIYDSMLCSGETGIDACQGDSGGPLAVEDGGIWKLIGVVSWGNGCGLDGYPGVYSNVSHLRPWLDNNL